MKLLAVATVCVALLSPAALAQTLPCPDLEERRTAKRDFVDALTAGSAALHQSRFAEAVSHSDAAAPHATDARQLQAALSVRSAALAAIADDAQLVPTLEKRLQVGCHARSGERDVITAQLEGARYRLSRAQ